MIYKTLHRKLKDWVDGQYNGRMEKDKKTINDLQNTTQKTKRLSRWTIQWSHGQGQKDNKWSTKHYTEN
jgi:hypothetical protein